MPHICTNQVPIFDLSPFLSDQHLALRKQAAKELAELLKPNGSVGFTGHAIPFEKVEQAFKLSKQLFALPYEEKMKAPHPKATNPHRGYSGPGEEHGAAKTALETDDAAKKKVYSKTTDYKESYDIGSEENKIEYNIWLPEETLPGFKQFTTELYWHLNKIAEAILDALLLSLDLTAYEEANVRALHTGFNNQLRLLHYPAIMHDNNDDSHDTIRHGAHKDWSTFTLLFQHEIGGLEFEDRSSGQFMPALPNPNVVYMNIGDMFERISNGFYPAAMHRVVSPKPVNNGFASLERYSIPYFVIPLADGVVEPQPSRVKTDGKMMYAPVEFDTYSKTMFKAINNRE